MGFNRRKMEGQRREAAEKEAAARRATDAQVLEDAERLIAAWNERQALRAPMLFSPTIGAPLSSRAFGFCGSAVPRVGQSTRSTYAGCGINERAGKDDLVNADAVGLRADRIGSDNYSSHPSRRLLAGFDRGISRYARHRDGLIQSVRIVALCRNDHKDD
jgi:hypothetical protein